MSVPHHRLALGAAAAVVLAGAAVVAVAQPVPPAPPTAPVVKQERRVIIERDTRGVPGRFDRRGPGGDRFAARNPEARAERLRTLLQLTAGQEGALKTYLAAMAPPEPPAAPRPASDTPPTAVERADRMAEMAGRMAAETKKRADATRAFYGALTPSQRKVFDTLPGPGGGRLIQIRNIRGDHMAAPPMPPMPPLPPLPGGPGRRG